MQLLVYLIAYPFLWCVSKLPFRLFYGLSDVIFTLVFYVFGYRKKVVFNNLKLAFPKKSDQELYRIQKAFYRHMCDMFLEMIKTINISDKELQKRFVFTNTEVLLALEKDQRSVMLMMPHYASWEWGFALDAHIQSKGYGIYQPIGNIYFDKLVRRIRGKFGTTLITTKQTKEIIKQNALNKQLSMYGIISDQSPMLKKASYWNSFMGIRVPIHVGAEKICKKWDLPAVYLKVEKLKRGYYQGTFKLLAENPKEHPDFEITDAFMSEVEKAIYEKPEYYFWTHKRWKHRGKEPVDVRR